MMDAAQAYDRVADDYDRSFKRNIDVIEDEIVFGHLEENGFTEGRVLELGCGTGLLLENLEMNGGYTGIDISRRMIGIAGQKFPYHDFRLWNMEDIGSPGYLITRGRQFFDVIVSTFGSFSYSRHPERTVNGIRRVLRPGGKFFIMVYGRPYEKRKHYILGDIGIARFYSTQELSELFRDFSDVSIWGFNPELDEYGYDELPIGKIRYSLRRAMDLYPADANYWLIVEGRG